jgi:tripartite-type tricarboxylate transporter receptor subunit TctC
MRRAVTTTILLAAFAVVPPALAQDYPTRPVTFVVPFPPGGITDNGARAVARVLSEKLGQQVIVDNKPGAAGIVGTEYVANAKKDGYTFLYAANGIVTYPLLYKKLSYNPKRDFIPVHGFMSSPMLVMVRADSPYRTLGDLIDFARKNPEKLTYGTAGTGSTQHFLGELLQKEAGVKLTHIPYKGLAPALTDLLAGAIDISFDYAAIMKAQIDGGKLRALGVSSKERLVNMPDIKTLPELGLPGAVFTGWATIVLPAGTPQAVVDRLADAFGKSLEDPAVVKYVNDQGASVMQGIAKDKLAKFYDDEYVKMKELIERADIKSE